MMVVSVVSLVHPLSLNFTLVVLFLKTNIALHQTNTNNTLASFPSPLPSFRDDFHVCVFFCVKAYVIIDERYQGFADYASTKSEYPLSASDRRRGLAWIQHTSGYLEPHVCTLFRFSFHIHATTNKTTTRTSSLLLSSSFQFISFPQAIIIDG